MLVLLFGVYAVDAIAKAAEEEKHAFDFKPKLATSTSPSRPNGDNHVRSPDIYTR